MTILITGGGGYIGSHVTLEALKSDLKVIVLDDFSTSYIENIERLKSELEWYRTYSEYVNANQYLNDENY